MILSIDIGNSCVKMIQSELNGDTLQITKVGSKFIENNSNKIPDSISRAQYTATINELCKELEINPRKMKNIIWLYYILKNHLRLVERLV